MHIHYISEQNSILNHFLAQIRDVSIQKDSMRFRKNIERIGEIMAYELSKTLDYKAIDVQTPLGIKHTTTWNLWFCVLFFVLDWLCILVS
jgi:uracil phosphoribosyltransferase